MTTKLLYILLLLVFCQLFFEATSKQCKREQAEYSKFGMTLRRHIFKRIAGVSLSGLCLLHCYQDLRCQSFNYVISREMCELNNRTKEARPEDYVPDSDRLYFRRDQNRVPLGSIPELPAETCTEIKGSEGGQAASKKYWFDSILLGKTVLAQCDMKTEDIDECSASSPVCDVNANCQNTRGSYICSCKPGFTGDGKMCSDIDECSASSPVCDVNANCQNTRGSYVCSCKPAFTGDGKTCSVVLTEFSTNGRKGRFGIIQTFTLPRSGRYRIKAWGAKGGTHSCNYGDYPGTFYGGKGALMEGAFSLNTGTVLNIVVGQRGGDSVEVKGGNITNQTAAELGVSVEDNAGTGGGGGSFVYTTSNVLLIAAGGGGGASSGYKGVDGQAGTAGYSSVGKDSSNVRQGGTGGQPGECNSAGGNYHGGVGAGWIAQGCERLGPEHGERGGSRDQGWLGGRAGGMNSGYNGGPPPGAVGGFGGGGGGSEDNGGSGGGGGYSGGGSGNNRRQAGGGGGSYCSGDNCSGVTGDNSNDDGLVQVITLLN